MDSFFSLFDPSDGNKQTKKKHRPDQDNAKKKADAPKGRRRGRKSNKNETLPEESSFLCEPELSTDLLVKDGSYIESYIELNKKDDEKQDDKKPKRRNSGRKSRRKKNKISPSKDLPMTQAWSDPDQNVTSWNNQASVAKICDENVGKNVNDLKSNKEDEFDKTVYKVIDKLEKVGLKDDMYLAGDFNTEELENDFFYSSDDLEDSFDDTSSEPDDSSEEVYGSLPPEPRFGNVEYKLQLVAPCERRFQHLVTQLKWRLRSGGGSAVYVLGVRDCGALRGLRARALRASLHSLRRMAATLDATLTHVTARRVAPHRAVAEVYIRKGKCVSVLRASLHSLRRMAATLDATLTHVTARRVAPHRAVAEVYIRKLADTQQSVELRVAVMGANEAGKSTLIGVLTQGELDNGRGSARLNMFRHLHEVKSGRTSSLSHEILGFDAQGNVVNYGCSELMTAERIGERSAKLVSFLDLAGHSKYQRTTLHGLSGYCPHRAMLLISATAGITRITEEHVGLLLALDLPFFAVISKCDIAAAGVQPVLRRLAELLQPHNKKPLLITDENLARNCVAPQNLILDTIDNGEDEDPPKKEEESSMERVCVFPVSCVRGSGLNALHAYLLALQPPNTRHAAQQESCEFQIDEIFHVGESAGPVVGGLMARGQLYEGDNLIIGPFETGEFRRISVRTIYRNRARCGGVRAGHCASLGLAIPPGERGGMRLRAGMVLLGVPEGEAGKPLKFGACVGACKSIDQAKDIVLNHQQTRDKSKNRKNVRRKNKNLLQDIANVESSLTKTIDNDQNIYKSDSEGIDKIEDAYRSDSECEKDKLSEGECTCHDAVLLEDPNNPRGCMFFQASVHVLRHSTAIYPGFQCTVHVGNVRQTAVIEGILSRNNEVRAGCGASLVFRFARAPEYLVTGRRLLLTAGQGTRGIGRVTQVFPYVP